MKSKMIAGTGIALFAVVSVVTGLRAQEQEAGQNASRVVFKTLFTFNNTDGADPSAALVQGTGGDFYGTTVAGLFNPDGTVFKISPQGKLTTIHNFDLTDGSDPQAALTLGTDGNFYGTTNGGGANKTACGGLGCGTIFKITPAGALTTLYSFCAQADCPDGASPGALVQGSDGNFYGTTYLGGTCFSGCGTVFKITPNGALTTLHRFNATGDGGTSPYYQAGLVQGTDGNFYGTTTQGGPAPLASAAAAPFFGSPPRAR